MIGMIIVDDELIIRQGLMTIPWNEYGIEIKGVAANGEEALDIAKNTPPQILLTDIRMPGMDGLALIDAVKSEIPDIKSILLTGYQDFGYAHSAIKLGAFGYVLKPSDPDEIVEMVLKAKKQVENEMREKLENELIRQQADSAKPHVLNSFLRDMIYGRIADPVVVSQMCSKYNLALKNYVVMLIEFQTESNLMYSGLLGKMKEEIHSISSGYNRCHVLDISQTTYCIINELPVTDEPLKDRMLSLATETRNTLKSKFDSYVSIGISRCGQSAADMHAVFNQAMNCLKMKFSLGKGSIIHVEDLMDSLKRQNVPTLKLTDEVFEGIKAGNYSKVEKLTRELLFRLAKEQKADEQMIKSVCFDILISSLRILKEVKFPEAAETDEQAFHSMLSGCTDVEELEECMINALMNIMDSIHSKTPTAKNKTISEILEYIETHYMDDISLLTVSEHVFMNHIYVSRLIKKETGETFLDILTRMRMKKACEMLANSDLKTYEISNLVGIKDSGYFSQVFKKHYEVTPSEYREAFYSRYRNNQGEEV